MTPDEVINLQDIERLFLYDQPTSEAVEIFNEHGSDPRSLFLHDLLRWHGSVAISNPAEIRKRKSFDCLLNFHSIVEIGLYAGYLPDPLPDDLRATALNHRSHPAVSNFYERNYPQFLPYLLRRRLNGEITSTASSDANAGRLFVDFLNLTTAYSRDANIRTFEWLLDGGSRGGIGLKNLITLLGDPEELARVLLEPRRYELDLNGATRGFYGFLAFCADLRDVLDRAREFFLLRAAMWHYYAYWFEIIGARVAHTLRTLSGASRIGKVLRIAAKYNRWFHQPQM